MKYVLSVLFIFSVLLLVSCQQEPDDVILSPSPSGVDDSTFLAAVVELDTTYPLGLDTSGISYFLYDSQKRLVQVRRLYYEPGAVGGTLDSYEKRFYTGNDTLPYKLAHYMEDAPTNDEIDTVFLTYQNGVIIKDSVLFYEGSQLSSTVIHRFKVLSGSRVSVTAHRRIPGQPDFYDSVISHQTWINGNLAAQKDTTFASPYWGFNFSYQYDNNPNPLLRFALTYPMTNYMHNIGDYSDFFARLSINNETGWSEEYTGGQLNHVELSYQYRADGYPLILRDKALGEPYKLLFIYQK